MAKAFDQELVYHEETKRRMAEFSKHKGEIYNSTPEQDKARDRMALFPTRAEVLFVDSGLWVVGNFMGFIDYKLQTNASYHEADCQNGT